MISTPKGLSCWIDALCLGLLAAFILAGAEWVPFHGDESTQMFMGRDYYYQFLEGDLSKIYYDRSWSSPGVEQHLRLVNGTVAKTIHGWLAASNGYDRDDLNELWSWHLDYTQNLGMNRVPESQLLRQARLASALQLSLATVLFYALVRITVNRPVAVVASALFALHPTVLVNGRRAMMEGSHLLGMMLVLLMAAWLIRERRWWKVLLLGFSAGFAIAAKHPNAFVVATVFLACGSLSVFEAARCSRRTRRRHINALAGLSAAALVTLLVFYLLNPAWWQAPVATASEVLSQRVSLLRQQAKDYGSYASLAEQAAGFFQHVFMAQAQYFEVDRWTGIAEISAQIKAYEASGLAGASIGGSLPGGLLSLTLTITGIGLFVGDRKTRFCHRWLLLFWGGGIALLTLVVTPLSWTRYYLPILPFVALMTGYCIVTLTPLLWGRIKKRVYGVAVLG